MRKHNEVREGQIVRVIDGPLTGFGAKYRQSGRSGIWSRYPDGLGTWADRIGARKFKLRHYNSMTRSHNVSLEAKRQVPRL
jgi:hypothetical protein